MKISNIILIATALLFIATFTGSAMINSGMVWINGQATPTSIWTGATVCFDIFPTDIANVNHQTVFSRNYALHWETWYVHSSVLTFENGCLWFSCDPGEWSIPIDENKWQTVCMTYDFNSNETSNPNFVVGKQGGTDIPTVTEDATPVGLLLFTTPDMNYFVGSNTSGVKQFEGQVGEIAVFGKKLGNGHMRNYAGSMMKGKCLQYANSDFNLLNCWLLDDITPNSTNTVSRAAYGGVDLIVNSAIGQAETGYSYQ